MFDLTALIEDACIIGYQYVLRQNAGKVGGGGGGGEAVMNYHAFNEISLAILLTYSLQTPVKAFSNFSWLVHSCRNSFDQ